jgi:hypothetical protein
MQRVDGLGIFLRVTNEAGKTSYGLVDPVSPSLPIELLGTQTEHSPFLL